MEPQKQYLKINFKFSYLRVFKLLFEMLKLLLPKIKFNVTQKKSEGGIHKIKLI